MSNWEPIETAPTTGRGKMKAWHFTSDTLRDGWLLPADGEVLRHRGDLIMCEQGLHASVRIIDALKYAPGNTICRVSVSGHEWQGHDDKIVCRERIILWRIDGEFLLRKFARLCALDVVHLWDCPDIVLRYLKTGDEKIRAAARDAAGAAAWAAAWDAAGAAAWAAAWDAAWAAAWDAAWAAARAAARDAAWAAAWAAQNKRLTRMVLEEHRRQR